MRNGTLLYAQSGGVTAVINATAAWEQQKSVMDYLIKPLNKVKESLRER